MKKVTTYFVSEVTNEIQKGKHEFDESVYEEGYSWNQDNIEENVVSIYLSLDEARKKLADYTTTFKKFSSHGFTYLLIDEFAIVERVYDFDSIAEDYEGKILNEDQFLNELKKDPWDFGDYEIYEESEDIYDFSKRNFTAEIRTDKGSYERKFINHADAKDWLEAQEEEREDEGIIDSQIFYY